ncbi:hypothetical protein [Nocardiopsis halophila]|uniref:hypothetical protein n=1 Tax=Nocardiopsis halophila TaxID=141692 RepID=UPI00034DC6E6|nr:hypothetical protein [Nocardiopsis halophila]
MPAPQHHPELTEEDRAHIRRHAKMRERGEEVPGYTIPAGSFATFEEYMDQVERILAQYRADRAAGRVE